MLRRNRPELGTHANEQIDPEVDPVQATVLGTEDIEMTHNHVSEFQLRVVHVDGTEELSGWMNDTEQIAQAIAEKRRLRGRMIWLQERTVPCPQCLVHEIAVVEYPVSDVSTPRQRPHDSQYLLAVGSRSRYEVFEVIASRR